MTPAFTYSILQYHHSIVLGEAINVGILFQFPSEEKLEFVAGTGSRLKAIYPDFDQTVYGYLIKNIEKKLKEGQSTLFREINAKSDLKRFINSNILAEDATVLQFADPVNVLGRDRRSEDSVEEEIRKAVDEFSKLLLPGIVTKKPEVTKHNESFLIKRFTGYVFDKHKDLEKKFVKNEVIKTSVRGNEIEVKFDLSWQNGSKNFIKPISFDLTEEKVIQDKSAANLGYLNLLGAYAKKHNYRFDFIVSEPQNKELYKTYENALGLIEFSDAPKRIIREKDLKSYADEAIEQLLAK